jgi:hypothetical protein
VRNKASKNKLTNITNMTWGKNGSASFRCHSVGPSSTNPRKKLVTDYTSRSIIFHDKDEIKRIADAMKNLVESEEWKTPGAKLHMTALTEQRNEKGIQVTLNISHARNKKSINND